MITIKFGRIAMKWISRKLYSIKKRLGLITVKDYYTHLKDIGIKIGDHTKLFSKNTYIDEQRPWMLEIGDYCKITQGVVILQHDYSRSVLRRAYGEVIGESKKTIIGDNVFIGINSIILMGAQIGNNVIIGAGSVVSGHIPDNVIVAGNPAKVIRSLDDHYKQRKNKYISEAVNTFLEFKNKKGKEPSISEMGSFWPLFLEKNREEIVKHHVNVNYSADDSEEIVQYWLSHESKFKDYDEFKEYCYNFERNNIIN